MIKILFFLTLFSLNSFGDAVYSVPKPDILDYQHQRTKDLVDLVYKAAVTVNKLGEKSFPLFRKPNSKWLNGDKYIFIITLDGKCLVHPPDRTLWENGSVLETHDIQGTFLTKLFIRTVTESGRPYGWVHYLASRPNGIFPIRKSSFAVKVQGPSGEEYILASGIYNARMEKAFIEEAVHDAADSIRTHGRNCFNEFTHASGRFVYPNFSIFVIDSSGNLIINPAFPTEKNSLKDKRNILNIVDSSGNYPIRKLIEKLKNESDAWIMYMFPKPGHSTASKMLIYARKVKNKNQEYIVGAGMFTELPIWMKD